jgi:hypothetical protein
MTGIVQTAYGINGVSFSTLPNPRNGILATMTATAAADLSSGVSLADNQGNLLGEVILFEDWDMVVGHQSLAIGFYGLLSLPSAPKGTYTVKVHGLPTGRNGGAAAIALFEVNGLRTLDQTGTNGSTAATNQVATGTACSAVNRSPNDLVIAALAVPDSVWINAPRYPPALGYTGVFSEVITPSGSGTFGALQAAYKVVDAIETSTADWGSIAIGGGYAWPWVSAVASFSLSAGARTSDRGMPLLGIAAGAPLAWIIDRRRRRASELVGSSGSEEPSAPRA